MKRFLITLGLVFGIVLTTTAQGKKEARENLTSEQKAELAVKRMALRLDLTEGQMKQIKPILEEKITQKEAFKKKRQEFKESGKKLSSDEHYQVESRKLDMKIAFKKEMKDILSAEQYEKFEKMQAHKGKKKHKAKMKGATCEKKACDEKK